MRVFVALELPDRVKDTLAISSSQLRDFSTKGHFVERDNMHITLHFLGEVSESNLIFVQSAMDGIRHLPAPETAISQIALMRGSNVVCAKIRQSPDLIALHDELGKLLEKNLFDVEHRAYRPHVTLLRNFGFTLPFSEVTKSVAVFNKPFVATEVVLYQSVLTKSGAKYTELYRISLEPKE